MIVVFVFFLNKSKQKTINSFIELKEVKHNYLSLIRLNLSWTYVKTLPKINKQSSSYINIIYFKIEYQDIITKKMKEFRNNRMRR